MDPMQQKFAPLRVFLFTEEKEQGWSKVHEMLAAILHLSQLAIFHVFLLHLQEIFACFIFSIQIRCKRPEECMLDMSGDAVPKGCQSIYCPCHSDLI